MLSRKTLCSLKFLLQCPADGNVCCVWKHVHRGQRVQCASLPSYSVFTITRECVFLALSFTLKSVPWGTSGILSAINFFFKYRVNWLLLGLGLTLITP